MRSLRAICIVLTLLAPALLGAEPAPPLRIVNARLIDGTGAPARMGSLRIAGDRIAAAGNLEPIAGEEVFATTAEIAEMSRLLERDLAAGALGLSTGLESDPGIYSSRAELLALARVAARHGGRYISHIRSEDRRFWEAVDEILAIGREAKLPVQISHVKLAMRSLWGEAPRLLAATRRREHPSWLFKGVLSRPSSSRHFHERNISLTSRSLPEAL